MHEFNKTQNNQNPINIKSIIASTAIVPHPSLSMKTSASLVTLKLNVVLRKMTGQAI